MISLTNLPKIISERGANELSALANTPTSNAVVGVLATRTHMIVEKCLLEDCFDVYLCRDDETKSRVVIPSPFTIAVFPESLGVSSEQAFRVLDDVLLANFVSDNPILAVSPDGLGDFGGLVGTTSLSLIDLHVADLVDILMHRPARDALLKRVIPATSLKLMNPYQYKGPIRSNMFVGREIPLSKLIRLEESYALVGPRTIGKTSLINRAYEEMRKHGDIVIRLEFSTAIRESDLLVKIVEQLVHEYALPRRYLEQQHFDGVNRLLEEVAMRSPAKRVALFIDEADELDKRCPQLTAMLKRLHNKGQARFALVGYKQLRRAVHSHDSDLMNVVTRLPLSRMSLRECGSLVFRPMLELGLEFDNRPAVQEAIYRCSGGAPSRVQMFCRAIVDNLSDVQRGTVTIEDVEQVDKIPWIHSELGTWYRDSTTPVEQILAGFAAWELPCMKDDFVAKSHRIFPELNVESEIVDLMLADVIDIGPNGLLDFSFPAARELARRGKGRKSAISELVETFRQGLNDGTLDLGK